eukprot:91749_1
MSVSRQFGDSVTAFALRLFRELCLEGPLTELKNLCISPLAIAACLAAARRGASTNSANQEEFTQLLCCPEEDAEYMDLIEEILGLNKEIVNCHVGSSIWLQPELNSDYERSLEAEFATSVHNLPRIPDELNEWALRTTQGYVRQALPSLSSSPSAALLSAFFLKALWNGAFDQVDMSEELFFTAPEEQVPCQMMQLSSSDFHYTASDLYESVDLPLGMGELSCTITLPNLGVSINALLAHFSDPVAWHKLADSALAASAGTLQLPRFRAACAVDLGHALRALGLRTAQDPGKEFGRCLSRMGNMHLSNIVHASAIEMDQSSVSAPMRAASEPLLTLSALSESPRARAAKQYNGFVMRAERPFLVMVRHRESGALLFIGRIGAPDGGQVSEPAPPSPVVVMPVQPMIVPNILETKVAEPDYSVESILPDSMTGGGDPNDGRNPCFTLRDTGKCQYGAFCRFSHAAVQKPGGSQPATAAVTVGGATGGARKLVPPGFCYQYHNTNFCKWGDNCRYSHGDPNNPVMTTGGVAPVPEAVKGGGDTSTIFSRLPQEIQPVHQQPTGFNYSQHICAALAETGGCTYGNICKYSHEIPAQS